jgi:Outer membrane receptor proteins, mostly Fe transport
MTTPLRPCIDSAAFWRKALGFVFLVFGCAAFAAEAALKTFDIPAGEAGETLKIFAAQSGEQLLYSPDDIVGVQTNAVSGRLTARAALERMVAETPLVVSQETRSGALALRRADVRRNSVGAAVSARATAVSGETVVLDEYDVTVTVQKRPQAAQEVPIAMTAVSGGMLERYRVTSLRDLSRLAPNMLVSSFSQTNPVIAIRGATNTFSQIGVSKPVAVVIDDVFIPRNTAASFELFDLDSVQILRGPQGTLFGRNVTGGAIVLNSRQPTLGAFEAEAQVEYGNYNEQKYQALVSAPLGDGVAAKITATRHVHDGYGRDRLTGREQDDQDSSNVRSQLLFRPGEHLKVLLSADYSDDRTGGRTLSSKGVGADGDRRTSELGFVQGYARTMWGVSGRVDWSAELGEFTSITAYRESQSGEDYSGTGASYQFLTGGSQSVTRDIDQPGTFSQELRYASPKGRAVDFVTGLYYLNEDGYRNLLTRAFAAGTGALVTHQIAEQRVATESYAGYLDGTWHITPAVGLTLGARYTVDRKEASLVRYDAIAPANNFAARGLRTQWEEFTPRVVLGWMPNKSLNLYASVTRGFTAGGYNTEAANVAILTKPFDPELVTNYEIGAKTQLWDGRLRVNAAVFHEDYTDKQELYFDTVQRILTIVNASEATMKGAEIEISYRATPALGFTFAYGLLDASYDSFVVPGVLNYTGNPLGSAPKNKASGSVDYVIPVRTAGTLTATVSYSWTDGYFTGATKDPNLFVTSYGLINASLWFEPAGGRWRFGLWGKNLGDTEYLLTPSTQGVLAEYLGEPRTYGVSAGWRF